MDKQSKKLLKEGLLNSIAKTGLGGLAGAGMGGILGAAASGMIDRPLADVALKGAVLGLPLGAITGYQYGGVDPQPQRELEHLAELERELNQMSAEEWKNLPATGRLYQAGVQAENDTSVNTPPAEKFSHVKVAAKRVLESSSLTKNSYIEKQKATNSKGEETDWVIKSHETDEVIGHYKTKEDAEKALQAMHANS